MKTLLTNNIFECGFLAAAHKVRVEGDHHETLVDSLREDETRIFTVSFE
jgi:hypothetical protein